MKIKQKLICLVMINFNFISKKIFHKFLEQFANLIFNIITKIKKNNFQCN